MFLDVTHSTERSVRMREVSDVKRLSAHVDASLRDSLETLLEQEGAGSFDGDHVWIRLSFILDEGAGQPDGWRDQVHEMFNFAESRSWLSEDREKVRAHIEWQG